MWVLLNASWPNTYSVGTLTKVKSLWDICPFQTLSAASEPVQEFFGSFGGSSVIHLCVCASMCSQYVHICVSAHMCECKDFTQFDLSSLISSGEETSSIHQVAIPEGDPTAELAKRPSSSSSLRACQKSLSAPSSKYLATRSFSLTSTRTVPLFSPTKTQSSANFLD